MTHATTTEATNTAQAVEEPKLFVRTVADILCRHLEKANTSVHWAQPAGSEVPWGAPKQTWPKDPDIGYLISYGNNEGTIVTVVHIDDRRNRGQQEALITIKFLCGMEKVFEEAAHVMKFIQKMDFQKMLQAQDDPKQRYVM